MGCSSFERAENVLPRQPGETPVVQHPGEITTDAIIDWVMTEYPETVPVFLRWRMHCVGCPIARFESIAEACANYQHPVEGFVAELRTAASRPGRLQS